MTATGLDGLLLYGVLGVIGGGRLGLAMLEELFERKPDVLRDLTKQDG
jgi:hypothetical protein